MVSLNPRADSRWFEADLATGSDTVTLAWLGRRLIPGTKPGTQLTATGCLSVLRGKYHLVNPSYELISVR